MNYTEYSEIVGVSVATMSRGMSAKKGKMRATLASKLSSGGFLTPYEWKHKTPHQRRKLWLDYVAEVEDKQLLDES